MTHHNKSHSAHCPGPFDVCSGRRGFLQTGLAGFATLSLPGILRLQAQNAKAAEESGASRDKNAVIMVWQPGGCSHIETYDPKPNASADYRGPFGTIPTKVPGLDFCELMPRQAAIADKFTVLRSMRQNAGGHPAGEREAKRRSALAENLKKWMAGRGGKAE